MTDPRQQAAQSFSNFYNTLSHSPHTYRLFRRSTAYYTAHYDTAQQICSLLQYNTLDRLSSIGSVPFIKLDQLEFTALVRLLLSQQSNDIITVELYERRDITSDNWYVSKLGTNHNWNDFAELNLNTMQLDSTMPCTTDLPLKRDSDSVMCIRASTQSSQRIVGIGVCIDTTATKQLIYTEFIDNDKLLNLYHHITSGAIALPSLCYVITDNRSKNELQLNCLLSMLNELDVKTQTVTLSKLESDLAATALPKLCNNSEQHIDTMIDRRYAMSALSCLVDKCKLNKNTTNHSFTLISTNLHQYASLDKSAREALNLFPVNKSIDVTTNGNRSTTINNDKSDTLYGLFNRIKLPAAERLLRTYMTQPLTNVEQINRRLNYVELLVSDHNLRHTLLHSVLRGIQDIQQNVRQLTSKHATLKNVVVLYQIADQKLPQLIHALEQYTGKYSQLLYNEFIAQLLELQVAFTPYCEMVRKTIDTTDIQHVIRINPAQDVALAKLDSEINECYELMNQLCVKYSQKIDCNIQKTNDKRFGYCMRVVRSAENKLKQIDGYERVTSVKSAVKFTTPPFNRIRDKHTQLHITYTRQQSEYTNKVIEIAMSYAIPFDNLNDFFAEIAVFVDLAHVAATYKYTRPMILRMYTLYTD